MEKQLKRIEELMPEIFQYSFDEMIKALQEAKGKGEHAYCNFNGYMFYSDTIDEKKAYLEYYDMTKEEKQHYEQERYKITTDIITSAYARLFISDGLYREFVETIVVRGSQPDLLQTYEYTFKNAGDILCQHVKPEYIQRFSQFNESRKNIARDFVNHYFPKENEVILEQLGLNQTQK